MTTGSPSGGTHLEDEIREQPDVIDRFRAVPDATSATANTLH